MDDTINYLQSHSVRLLKEGELRESNNSTLGATVGMLWLDIEGTQVSLLSFHPDNDWWSNFCVFYLWWQYWSSSTSNNVNFLQGMVDEGKKRGISLGIYSSKSQWNPIMGGTSKFSSLPLWYAHYDNNPSYSDFTAFGGWSKPSIKQYAGTTSICSASVDKNYY